MKKTLLLFSLTIFLMSTFSVAMAAPPQGAKTRALATETVMEKDGGTLSVELGYDYAETKDTHVGGSGDGVVDRLPMLLRFQALPMLEIRGGATPILGQPSETSRTDLELGALIGLLPSTVATPGLGLLIRGIGPIAENKPEHFGELEIRMVSGMDIFELFSIDLNVGYWFAMGGTSACSTSVLGTSCAASPQHYVPLMVAARLPLFGLFTLFVESESYVNIDAGLSKSPSTYGFGSMIHLGDDFSLDIATRFGVTEVSEDFGISTGIRWTFVDLY
jgi:hypothetical protein